MSITILEALAREEIEVGNLLLKDNKSCNVVTSPVVVIMEVAL